MNFGIPFATHILKLEIMNLLIVFLSLMFVFLTTFGGTIIGKIFEDYRTLKKEKVKGYYDSLI